MPQRQKFIVEHGIVNAAHQLPFGRRQPFEPEGRKHNGVYPPLEFGVVGQQRLDRPDEVA